MGSRARRLTEAREGLLATAGEARMARYIDLGRSGGMGRGPRSEAPVAGDLGAADLIGAPRKERDTRRDEEHGRGSVQRKMWPLRVLAVA